jgi:hypothetical protein
VEYVLLSNEDIPSLLLPDDLLREVSGKDLFIKSKNIFWISDGNLGQVIAINVANGILDVFGLVGP